MPKVGKKYSVIGSCWNNLLSGVQAGLLVSTARALLNHPPGVFIHGLSTGGIM